MKFLRKFSSPLSLFIFSFVFLIALSVSLSTTQAAVIRTMTGAIDPEAKTARFYDDPTSLVNFKPSYVDPSGGSVAVRINTSDLSGYAWGNKVGWISFNSRNCDPDGDGSLSDAVYDFCPAGSVTTFKVSKDVNGRLSGYAWGENTGWINFGAPAPGTAFQSGTAPVTINSSTGAWSGFAWAENYGWLRFDCSVANGCVKAAFSSSGTGGGGTPPIYGNCSSANGGTFSTAPIELCTTGTASPSSLSGDGPWTWNCLGNSRGFDNYNNGGQSCSANFSPIAPPPPTLCEDETAENFNDELPCIYKLEPPIELCIIGTDCEPVLPILPPNDLCIIGSSCDVPAPTPVLPTLDRPILLCILGFSCDPGSSVLPTIERPSLLCVLGFGCEPAPEVKGFPPTNPIDSPRDLCVEGVNCPIN